MGESIYNSHERMPSGAQAFMDEVARQGRILHPERFSPDGEPLINYPGGSWMERRASWYRAHGYQSDTVQVPA